jgi:hypothetical protein
MPFTGRSEKDPKGFGSVGQPEAKPPAKVKAASKEDMKWKLEPRDVPEWLEWVDAQKKAAAVSGKPPRPSDPGAWLGLSSRSRQGLRPDVMSDGGLWLVV